MPSQFRAPLVFLSLLLCLASPSYAESWRYLPEHSNDGRYAVAFKQAVYLTHDPDQQLWYMQLALPGVTSKNNSSITFEREYGSNQRIEIGSDWIRIELRPAENFDVIQINVSQDMLEKMHDAEAFTFAIDGKNFSIPLKGASYVLSQANTAFQADITAGLTSTNTSVKKRAQTLKAMNDCHRHTSHRWDRYRRAKPVKWADINAPRAVAACEKALELHGPTPRLLFQLGRAYDKAGNPAALKTLDDAAWSGEYPAAFYHLAILHEDGTYTTKDATAARRTYLEGWSYGNVPSTYTLGRIDLGTAQTSNEKSEAIDLIRRAADAGYPRAMAHMGDLLFKGLVNGSRRADAVPYYKGASRENNAKASYRLHKMYKNGNGIPADGIEANFYLLKAMKQGHKQAKIDWQNQ